MKICKICAQNDMLCHACNEKLKSGSITETDVAVSRAIYKIAPAASFIRSIGNSMVLILADKNNAARLIGRSGRNAKLLEKELGKKMRVIEKSEDKEMIENIFGFPIIGINVLYSKEQRYRVRVQKQFQRRLRHEYVEAVNALLDKKVDVVFE
ncbi:MAG: hypothetical protein HYT72_02655 [Candidatus Aenigmarchaeota archaeon]|nr:hypothetical protein [Candidatus Aenigmarchaeota archaeon]